MLCCPFCAMHATGAAQGFKVVWANVWSRSLSCVMFLFLCPASVESPFAAAAVRCSRQLCTHLIIPQAHGALAGTHVVRTAYAPGFITLVWKCVRCTYV